MMCATFQQPATKGCFTAAELRGMRPPVYPFYQRSNSCAGGPFRIERELCKIHPDKTNTGSPPLSTRRLHPGYLKYGLQVYEFRWILLHAAWSGLLRQHCRFSRGVRYSMSHRHWALPPYLRNRDGENGNGECRHGLSPLTINRSCQRYTYKHVPRFQRQCGREDCLQIKSVGCKYVNADGFCYRLSGQRFCAENQDDKRCFIDIPNVMHARCNSMRSVPLPPLPDAVAGPPPRFPWPFLLCWARHANVSQSLLDAG